MTTTIKPLTSLFLANIPKYHSIPEHYIIVLGGTADTCRGVLLQSLKVPHQSLPCRSRHPHHLNFHHIPDEKKNMRISFLHNKQRNQNSAQFDIDYLNIIVTRHALFPGYGIKSNQIEYWSHPYQIWINCQQF